MLLFASLFSFLMLPFAHADQGVSLSDLHQKVMGDWKLDSINGGVQLVIQTLVSAMYKFMVVPDVTLCSVFF